MQTRLRERLRYKLKDYRKDASNEKKPSTTRLASVLLVDQNAVPPLTSQLHASASQGRICSGKFTCCHTEIFFFFFFCAFPSYISGVHHFWVRFLRMWPFVNPTITIVTFRLRGWCVLGVSFLPAFTRLGHERQDLLNPWDEMHVCTD